MSGSVINRCTALPAGTAPALQMVGKGGYTFAASTIVRTSGDLLITNDLTLTDIDFAAPPLGAPGIRGSGSGESADWFAEASVYFEFARDEAVFEGDLADVMREALPSLGPAMFVPICFVGGNYPADPDHAANGTSLNPTGNPGKDGSNWTLLCRGEMQIANATVIGQDGGAGGDGGPNQSATAANATGGKGGNGGLLRIKSTLGMILGGGNTFTSGGGGKGGDATAAGTPNPDPPQAASAAATGGVGGDAGLLEIRGKTGIDISGGLNLVIRPGGNGGNATSTAADGFDATATKPTQLGGISTANGGDGGKTPDKQLGSSGTVAGLGNVTVSNGNGGNAGFGDAQGGKGGNGVIQNKPGAAGGAIAAMPGRGGNAEVRNQLGTLIGTGGTSGEARFRRGTGGNGYSDCIAPLTEGGKGGDGGGATGGGRLGGTGAANGAPGTTRQTQNSNGGNGGHGLGPGARGEAGSNGIVGFGPFVTTDPVFTPGTPGRGCRFNVVLTVGSDPAPPHNSFVSYTTILILDVSVNGTTITFTGIAGGKWITVTGTYNPETGAFTAGGSGTAAAIPNVPATFTGTINLAAGTISGTVTLFGSPSTPPGGLPGHGTTYNVTGTVAGATP